MYGKPPRAGRIITREANGSAQKTEKVTALCNLINNLTGLEYLPEAEILFEVQDNFLVSKGISN